MIRITISGLPGSCKSWAALIIKAALTSVGGCGDVELVEEDLTPREVTQRQIKLLKGARPLAGKRVLIEQRRTAREPGRISRGVQQPNR